LVLRMVEVEDLPTGAEVGPGRDPVTGDEETALGPPEGQVTGRMPRRVHDLQRAERIAFVEQLVDGARRVLGTVEPEAELGREQLEGLVRNDRPRLRATIAGDDVRLPDVGVDRRAGGALELGEAAEMRAVCVRDRDPLDVGDRASEAPQ